MSLPNIFNNEGQLASYQTRIIEGYPMLIMLTLLIQCIWTPSPTSVHAMPRAVPW